MHPMHAEQAFARHQELIAQADRRRRARQAALGRRAERQAESTRPVRRALVRVATRLAQS